MPEAKLLFGIAAVVILGLVAWVVTVLRAPRETWAREGVVPQPHPYDRHPDAAQEPELIGDPAPPAAQADPSKDG